jgi:hypothetical protein
VSRARGSSSPSAVWGLSANEGCIRPHMPLLYEQVFVHGRMT